MSSPDGRKFRDWLSDIVSWGDRAADYVRNMDEAEFAADTRTQDAVIRCLECIGEASRHVLASGRAPSFPEIEFIQAYWTRNRLAHGYYDVNQARVWVTVTESLPALVVKVRGLLDELE